jgi:SAM-dependent methyltransferase
MSDWYDNDAFWTGAGSVIFDAARWEAAVKDVDHIVGMLGLSAGMGVLDLPCGPGRHALELARRGFRVTGVDRTAAYLEQARQRATNAALPIDWVQADMRGFRRANTYDAALNLFTSFGYFADAEDDRRVAENFFASLKPGGRLVLELMGKEVLARAFQARRWDRLPDGRLWLEERALRDDWSWIDVCWMVLGGQQREEYRLRHRLYSATELKLLLSRVGFTRLRAFGSLAGTPYDHAAARLVVVAEKPVD